MEQLIRYFRLNRRMRRKTFILIMAVYLVAGAAASTLIAPSAITHAQNINEAMRAEPISYYVFGLLITFLAIPAYAARLMDIKIRPYFALLFLFPICFNLAQKSGIITFTHEAYPHTLMTIIGGCNLLAQLFLMVCPGTKGPNRYGPEPVTATA